jgi:hypothetical protein
MSNFLYGRKFKIYVAKKDDTAWDVTSLRVKFNIEKVAKQTANYAEVEIYNLTRDTENAIIQEGTRVIIEAGYQGTTTNTDTNETTYIRYGKIFDGDIIQSMRDRDDNVDYILKLVCIDGDSFLNNNIIKMTLNSGVTQRQIVENIAANANKPTEVGRITADLSDAKLPRGKVFFGVPKGYLRNVSNGNGANFWIEDNQLQVASPTDDFNASDAIVITPQNGMIGIPAQTEYGVQVKCLLDPRIKLMSMIKIDNTMIRQMKQQIGKIPTMLDQDGQYQVYKLKHTGDTRDNEWYTDIDGIGRNGKIPLQLASGGQSLG